MQRRMLLALCALCLAAATAAHAADPVVLQLKWLPQTQFAGYYVAEAKGLYRNAGLAVTIKPGGPDIDPSAVLASGGADVAVDWMAAALAARDRGAPLVNIAQIFQRSGMMLTCRRDSGIRRPADLKGKTLAVWFSGNQYPFLAWMAKLGFRTEGPNPDVTVLRQGGGVDLLVDKRAACISTMSYNEYWQVIDSGIRPSALVAFRYEDQGVATLEDGLYTTAAKLADPMMRGRLARFLRASVAGWQYALTHQQEAVGIVLRANESGGGLDASHQQRMLQEVAKLIPGNHHTIGYLEPAAYERTVDVLLAGGTESVIHRRPDGAWMHLNGAP
ncbi:MAG: ABC transporter substrate-binding protein [Stellaceae bacterium]